VKESIRGGIRCKKEEENVLLGNGGKKSFMFDPGHLSSCTKENSKEKKQEEKVNDVEG